MDDLIKETKRLLRKLDTDERGELLGELLATWCPCCGSELGEDGECCD